MRGGGVRVCHLTSVHPANDTRIFEKECLSLAAAGYDGHRVAPAAASGRVRGITIAAMPPARGRGARAIVTTARVEARAISHGERVDPFHTPESTPTRILLR